jgi:signal transduction histidine kinase
MNRPIALWSTFAIFTILGLGALGWITREALILERAEARANRRAAYEDNIRLALWRLDSMVAPLVARESARPPQEYFTTDIQSAFLIGDADAPDELEVADDSPVPEPLRIPFVELYFQIHENGAMTSPFVLPFFSSRSEVVEPAARSSPEKAELLEALKGQLDREKVLTALKKSKRDWIQVSEESVASVAPEVSRETQMAMGKEAKSQEDRSRLEFQARSKAMAANQAQSQALAQQPTPKGDLFVPPGDTGVESQGGEVFRNFQSAQMTPVWMEGQLFLARKVPVKGEDVLQLAAINWAGVRKQLLKEIDDLLPEADLVAVPPTETEAEMASRQMASLPVAVEPEAFHSTNGPVWTPFRLVVLISWIFVLAALVGGVVLVNGLIRLSERRAAFVSAVTHELRSPLTTFRMYTEMLTERMVADEKKRSVYLETLRREADRLIHLVENVLSYARLERNRASGSRERIPVESLVERVTERLDRRVEEEGMILVREVDADAAKREVETDPSAVEQIVFNLVDNACKYAQGASDRRIHVRVTASKETLEVRVCDHGPGISRDQAARLFRPFRKSAMESAHSAPGVGLGLALSRRLARSLGGDLSLECASQPGACFRLRLPLGQTGTKSERASNGPAGGRQA